MQYNMTMLKKPNIAIWFKKLTILVLPILVIQLIKLIIIEKLMKIKRKITIDYDHTKYITTQEFNKLASQNFVATLV